MENVEITGVAAEGKSIARVDDMVVFIPYGAPGDVVNIAPGVKHWHGAAPDSWFSHLAVEVPGENCRSLWCEPVSEEEYRKLK